MLDQPVLIFTYITAAAFLAVVVVIILKMISGTIDLSTLLSESGNNKASLSRLQFLLFTFVIAGLYLILSLEAGQLIDIPSSALGLLGISGGSYIVSKGIASGKGAPKNPESTSA